MKLTIGDIETDDNSQWTGQKLIKDRMFWKERQWETKRRYHWEFCTNKETPTSANFQLFDYICWQKSFENNFILLSYLAFAQLEETHFLLKRCQRVCWSSGHFQPITHTLTTFRRTGEKDSEIQEFESKIKERYLDRSTIYQPKLKMYRDLSTEGNIRGWLKAWYFWSWGE